MPLYSLLLTALASLLIGFALSHLLSSRATRRAEVERAAREERLIAALTLGTAEKAKGMEALLDKSIGIIASRDPLAFQAVQAMNLPGGYDEPYDPSDEAEVERLKKLGREQEDDGIGYHESSVLTDLGVDPAFLRSLADGALG